MPLPHIISMLGSCFGGEGVGGWGGVPEGVGDNSNPPAVSERKQDFSFCFSIRGVGGGGDWKDGS